MINPKHKRGKPCIRGHGTLWYVNGSKCVVCVENVGRKRYM